MKRPSSRDAVLPSPPLSSAQELPSGVCWTSCPSRTRRGRWCSSSSPSRTSQRAGAGATRVTRRRVSRACGMGTGFGERCAQWAHGKGAPSTLLGPAHLCAPVQGGVPKGAPALLHQQCHSAPTNPTCLVRCREAEEQEARELAPAGSAQAGPDGAPPAQQPVCPGGTQRDENQPRKDLGEPSASSGASQAGAAGRLAVPRLSWDQPRSRARSCRDAVPVCAPQTLTCPLSPAAAPWSRL